MEKLRRALTVLLLAAEHAVRCLMRSRTLPILAICSVLLCLFGSLHASQAEPDGSTQPVVLELFTSEGCSSCPPADRLLAAAVQGGKIDGIPVIGLEWHVDYWNYLGWTDPFSLAAAGALQADYAKVIPGSRTYTPQLVVDGGAEGLGSDPERLRTLVHKTARNRPLRISLERHENTLSVLAEAQPAAPLRGGAEVYLVMTETGLSTKVLRGENAGKTLPHGPVVRSVRKLGSMTGGRFQTQSELALDRAWRPGGLAAVVLLRHPTTLRILAAAELPIGRCV